MAKRKRSRRTRKPEYYFHGFGADDFAEPQKETDWFWPVAISAALLALFFVVKNTKRGESVVAEGGKNTGGGGGNGPYQLPSGQSPSSSAGRDQSGSGIVIAPGLDPSQA